MPPLSLMIKPVSSLCNLRCKYCFYADETLHRNVASYGMMTTQTLEIILQKALAQAEESITIAFQGGEPTLIGLEFYQFATKIVKKWNIKHIPVHYAFQTNGILLNDLWAKFFVEHDFLVGISLDGTKKIHDCNRVDPCNLGTFETVLDRIALLKKYHISFNILTVVTNRVAENVPTIYRFFSDNQLLYQQYIPCISPIGTDSGSEGLTAKNYLRFLKNLFDRWYRDVAAGKFVYNQYFENLIGILRGQMPESCGLFGQCCMQYVAEADGSIYPCDFYVLDEYRLGNLVTDTFLQIDEKREQIKFIEKSREHDDACYLCRWFFLCRGGCRRDRQMADNTLGRNYLCSAYQGFFEYAMPKLLQVARSTWNN